MKDLIIFGAGTIGKLAAWYFEHSSEYRFVSFCVDDAYLATDAIRSKRIISMSDLEKEWPPGSSDIFVAIGYQKLNRRREELVSLFVDKGYNLASCIAKGSVIHNDHQYGYNCFIMENAVLQPFSRVGNNCIVWSGAVVSHEARIGNNCFLAANCTVGGRSEIGDNCFLGIGACVRDSIKMGAFSIAGAGSVILSSVPQDSFIPAKPTKAAPFSAHKAMKFIDI